MNEKSIDSIMEEFEQKFCTSVGGGGVTVVRWLNVGSNSSDNAKLTRDIYHWIKQNLTKNKMKKIDIIKAEDVNIKQNYE